MPNGVKTTLHKYTVFQIDSFKLDEARLAVIVDDYFSSSWYWSGDYLILGLRISCACHFLILRVREEGDFFNALVNWFNNAGLSPSAN